LLAFWLGISFALIKTGESDDVRFLGTLGAIPLATIVCYVIYAILQHAQRKPTQPAAAVAGHIIIGVIFVVGSAFFAYEGHWVLWDPIECPGAPLETDSVRTIPNRSGDTATVRRSACEVGLLAGSDAEYYFVFVHRSGQQVSAKNLALRYDTDDAGWNQPPHVEWIDENTLRITGRSTIFVVSQQRSRIGNTQILYRLPRPEYGTNITPWQRLYREAI
jgi:hypothetical protein